jgi:hypothetical protein
MNGKRKKQCASYEQKWFDVSGNLHFSASVFAVVSDGINLLRIGSNPPGSVT